MKSQISRKISSSARKLAEETDTLTFGGKTAFVYNPLQYAWSSHAEYIDTYGNGEKRVLFIGMNPGPWGMAQTGIPFGEINAVKTWLKIDKGVEIPEIQHPKKPIQGFECSRSEVSGRRLWALMRSRFRDAEHFFSDHYVANYCPLIFLEEGGKNLTPDKLSAGERSSLFKLCDNHLREIVKYFRPEYVIGVGKFAEERARTALQSEPASPSVASILHPSPASPMANRGWAEQAEQKLVALGIWQKR